MRLFAGVPWRRLRRGVERSWGCGKRRFSVLGRHIFVTLRNEANIIIQYYFEFFHLFTNRKIRDLEWPFYVKFSLLRTPLSKIILHTYRGAYV